MIYVRKAGGEIKDGFNFYPLLDRDSFGFILRYGLKAFRCRYSKNAKKWFIGFNNYD